MLKTLQRKFIAIAMASVAVVLTLLVCSINIVNYINVNTSADIFLDILSGNSGKFPMEEEVRGAANTGAANFLYSEHFHIPAEAAYSTRYFTVTLSEDGTVHTINTSKISAISTSDASDYATTLFSKGKESGFVDNYKYRRIKIEHKESEKLKQKRPKPDKDETPKEDGEKSDDAPSKQNEEMRYMYIFLDCEQDLTTFHNFLIASIAISLAGFVGVFILVVFFSRKAIQPVVESYAKQKRFITDASHEIKTPLTIIDANTEIIEMMEGENEWTQSIRNQINRLAELTNKMVFLTRMDEENAQFTMLDFSLSDAVIETVEPFSAVAQTKNRKLVYKVEPNISYHGDESMIRQLLSLLVDNAIKYSTDPGEIRVELHASGKNRILKVWNTVEEMEKGSHDELFDRFYRRDASRSQKTAGHGIGLSVVQAIVQAHKGKITARSEDGNSLQFTITL